MKYSLLAVAVMALTLTACEYKKHPMDKPPPLLRLNVNRHQILTILINLAMRRQVLRMQAVLESRKKHPVRN